LNVAGCWFVVCFINLNLNLNLNLVGLLPDKNYQVKLTTGEAKADLSFKTRNDQFPIGKMTILPGGESDKTIVITEAGTPQGYHLVTRIRITA